MSWPGETEEEDQAFLHQSPLLDQQTIDEIMRLIDNCFEKFTEKLTGHPDSHSPMDGQQAKGRHHIGATTTVCSLLCA